MNALQARFITITAYQLPKDEGSAWSTTGTSTASCSAFPFSFPATPSKASTTSARPWTGSSARFTRALPWTYWARVRAAAAAPRRHAGRKPARDRRSASRSAGEGRGQMSYKIPMGPYHPALEEPYKLDLICEGETVCDAKLHIGFNFRGIEHLAETRNYIQVIALMERVCGICSNIHTLTLCQAMERFDRPGAAAARALYSRRHGGTGAAALARALGRHRRQAHGLQNHVHDLLRDAREGDGRASGHQRQSRQLLDEPYRRRQSRYRRSSRHAGHGGCAGARDGSHRHSHLHHQLDGALALRRHRRPDARESSLLRRCRSHGARLRRRPGPAPRRALRGLL